MPKKHTPIHETAPKVEKALLVALTNPRQPPNRAKEYLDELAFLACTLGIETMEVFTQNLEVPHPKTFINSGKLEDVVAAAELHDVDMIIFDDELSAGHVRNLERAFGERKVLDRSLLILQIFMQRAKTAQAKAQVELAHYQYMLPRLTRMWSHLSRQRGGIGMRGGPGEKELETDRRIVRDKISLLRQRLDKFELQTSIRAKQRDKLVRVALVGYTNAGKSTLMRQLSKADVYAKDELFATIDSTVRKIVWEGIPFLLTDTVGFIRKLPTTLIESFKSTLSEVVEADVLIHVVDVSHAAFDEHIEVVQRTLLEIGAADKPTLLVFNKIDQYRSDLVIGDNYLICPPELEDLRQTYMAKEADALFVSATEKSNFDTLRSKLFEKIKAAHRVIYPNYLM
ncbi:MAG: GTPase HflX [Bernardetiaceae bacterium]